jgi:hypothetical protein
VYWSGLELGVPPGLHEHLHRLQPGYTPGFRLVPFVIGALFTIGWFAVLFRVERDPQRPAWIWASGVTLTWGLLGVLFIGWVDVGKSYRGMVVELQQALPSGYRCMSSLNLGDTERAMLHYFANIVTYREESPERRRDCDLLLVQGTLQGGAVPGPEWVRIWEGARPGDRIERYWLYRHSPAVPAERERRPSGPARK